MSARRRIPLHRPAGADRWVLRDGEREYAAFVLPRDGDRAGAQDEIVVVDAACPHKGGPLVEGIVRDGSVVCPWHWYAFDLATGACRSTGAHRLARHPVVHEAGEAFVDVPADAPLSFAEKLRAHARGER